MTWVVVGVAGVGMNQTRFNCTRRALNAPACSEKKWDCTCFACLYLSMLPRRGRRGSAQARTQKGTGAEPTVTPGKIVHPQDSHEPLPMVALATVERACAVMKEPSLLHESMTAPGNSTLKFPERRTEGARHGCSVNPITHIAYIQYHCVHGMLHTPRCLGAFWDWDWDQDSQVWT